MSCEQSRHKYFERKSASGVLSAEELERVYQQNRHMPGNEVERLACEAKTRLLFADFAGQGLRPPTHAASGLPKSESQPGYAAVYDLLRRRQLIGSSGPAVLARNTKRDDQALCAPNDPRLGLDGRDQNGMDRWGFNPEGFDAAGYDREGFNRDGWNRLGFNRQGLDAYMRAADGFGRDGYNKDGVDQQGFDKFGYHPVSGRDADGFDRNGYDPDGYDRDGYDRRGRDRKGDPDPDFLPDADGYYPDGYDLLGYDREGYDLHGLDRWGFGRDGYNLLGWDRNGYDRNGDLHHRLKAPDGYDSNGYKNNYNRSGYDWWGFKNGRSFTGFDRDLKDASGQPRKVLNEKGRWVRPKYDSEGFDEQGYDQRGYHRDSGLTAPDDQGRRYNTYGWIYDEDSDPVVRAEKLDEDHLAGRLGYEEYKAALDALAGASGECYDPQDPTRRMKNGFKRIRLARRTKRLVVVSDAYLPSPPPPPIDPQAFVSAEIYNAINGSAWDYPAGKQHLHVRYSDRMNPDPTVGQRRGALENKVLGGIRLRCPHCGQFTGGGAHACPSFAESGYVRALHSGVVLDDRGRTLFTPHNPDYDPEFDIRYGYSSRTGFDRAGYDRLGYNQRGFNREGYDRVGYDVFGYDRDGYDRTGYNNMGVNRRGERRGKALQDVQALIQEEGQDLLANEDLARMYGQIASGLIGKPRRVVLREGEGFATDMKGTIYADPYPLGRGADPRHNLIVTRAGIYHELGHEQFTPQPIWGQVLEAAQGRPPIGLGEVAQKMLPRFYNIVEDGRMEREVARRYKGAAEILAASCRLEPRWGETVGPGVSESDQVFWALLYTGLPYFRVRQEVRQGMTPRARQVFEELEPVVIRAVRGTPEEAFDAAVRIARRFEEEGFLQLPPEDYSQPMPKPQGGGGQPQQGQSGGGQPQRSGSGEDPSGNPAGRPSTTAEEDERKGRPTGSSVKGKKGRAQKGTPDEEQKGSGRGASGSSEDEKQGRAQEREVDEEQKGSGRGASDEGEESAPSSADGNTDEFLFGHEVVDAAMRAVERDAASALENGVRSRSRAATIGKPLHQALPREDSMEQRYRAVSGMPKRVRVALPKGRFARSLQDRRARHREVAAMMAKPLKAIREQTEQRLRRQTEGRLDRRQLVNAYKGMEDVRTQIKERPRTSFAASLMVDLSGSMREQVTHQHLYDSVMTLGDCFDLLDMPYEVRAFGSSSAQVKAMHEPFDPDRAAYLAEGDLGGTALCDTAGLAHSSLLATEENNKMMICLSDGSLDDHNETARILREARRNGLLTFGIFLGAGANQDRLDELYGRGNWTAIQSLGDMPKLVAQRLASIFKSMR